MPRTNRSIRTMTALFGAAIVLAFYEQHKRKRSSLATSKAQAVTETNTTGQPE